MSIALRMIRTTITTNERGLTIAKNEQVSNKLSNKEGKARLDAARRMWLDRGVELEVDKPDSFSFTQDCKFRYHHKIQTIVALRMR